MRRPWVGPGVSLILLLGAAVLSAQEPVPGQRDFVGATVETRLLNRSVYLMQVQKDGTLYNTAVLVDGKDALLVDHVDAPAAPLYRQELAKLGVERIRFLIPTHWHYDHVGGNEVYGREATIVAQENIRRRLATRQTPWWSSEGIGPSPAHARPVLTFDQALRLHFGDEEVQLWHFGPAHTDGDTVVYFTRARVVVMGDLFHGRGAHPFGEDIQGMARSYLDVARRITPDAIVVTGHGRVSTRRELLAYQALLAQAIVWVNEQTDAGRSLEEMLESEVPKAWLLWVEGDRQALEEWLYIIHRSLKGELSGS